MAGPEVSAGRVRAPVIPLLLVGLGAYLAWFGTHYWRQDIRWPSDPVKAVLQGKSAPASVPPPSQVSHLEGYTAQWFTLAGTAAPVSGAGAFQGSVPAGSAQNTAKLLLAKYGWGAAQMGSLIRLWTQESGWSASARNPTSGAYGIAQALGHGGANTAAPDGTNEYGAQYGLTPGEAQQANAGNARWQIEWGLGYIKDRYGSPDAAWAHEQANNWY